MNAKETIGPAAAIDLGSNSFHLIIGRFVDGSLHIVDRLRVKVRLAGGLGRDNRLDDASQLRAIDCLNIFREHLDRYDVRDVTVAGTSTFRRAANAKKFRKKAERALGHPIRILSGEEEAKLIFKGVTSTLDDGNTRREAKYFITDIGGGSTECVVADGPKILHVESFEMGCVPYSNAFFPDGEITAAGFDEAIAAAIDVLDDISAFESIAGRTCYGASGTARNIERILLASGWSRANITLDGMESLRDRLIDAGTMKKVNLLGLKENRRPVLPGGLAIMLAVFERFEVDHMNAAPGALREGLLFEWYEEQTAPERAG